MALRLARPQRGGAVQHKKRRAKCLSFVVDAPRVAQMRAKMNEDR
jgi:hypothetical protein